MDHQEAMSVEPVKKNIPRGYDQGIASGNNPRVIFSDLFARPRSILRETSEKAVPVFYESIDLAMMLGISIYAANQMLLAAAYSLQAPGDVIAMAQARCDVDTIRLSISNGVLREMTIKAQARAAAEEEEAMARLSALASLNEEKEKKDKPAVFLSDRERRRQMIRARMRREACETRPKKICIHRKRCDSMRHLNVLLC